MRPADPSSPAGIALVAALRAIVGPRHVLTDPRRTARHRTGFRFGSGPALAVVEPGGLVEQWRVLQACTAAGVVVILQAANTGLTGGSTPDGDDYDRPVVILSTVRLNRIRLLDGGRQVLCHPGARLYELEDALRPLGREPHSVIGSSCIGASVLGGVSNNSGGALIHRGPAYTELALFARVDENGALTLVNHLGIALGDTPEAILGALDRDDFDAAAITNDPDRMASDRTYATHVRDVEADTPARFNADPRRLHEASGSAGKVVTFAVRLDTFPMEKETQVFYIGTNDPAELETIRRHILARFETLPVAGEYMHRAAYDIAAVYGKDMFLAIHHLGTARLPALFALKGRLDAALARVPGLPRALTDRLMQAASRLFPPHLPPRMNAFRDRYEHHLMLKMGGAGIAEARAYLSTLFPSATGDLFECTPQEGTKAFLHRFAAAGAAIRYRAVHSRAVEDIVALDIALKRSDRAFVERLPDDMEREILHKLYYGHFFCHVFHQDYIVAKGHDPLALEHRMWALLDARGARYPAEHNFGHLYDAPPEVVAHYRGLDPCNCFNPGIGRTTKALRWTPPAERRPAG
ncbi:D-lactate dehydrogenase [Xanthobacter sp. V4C-4]|uniref:D-lactate dehydrogenase n=1 Tax=Xanthobacter cornucopiae TaxID=3119924 RepID=UPI00372C78F9